MLKELLEKYPQAKKEYEDQIQCLSHAGLVIIEEQGKWIEKLEDMIEDNVDREEILKEIDARYWYTVRMQDQGVLDKDTEWWETVL